MSGSTPTSSTQQQLINPTIAINQSSTQSSNFVSVDTLSKCHRVRKTHENQQRHVQKCNLFNEQVLRASIIDKNQSCQPICTEPFHDFQDAFDQLHVYHMFQNYTNCSEEEHVQFKKQMALASSHFITRTQELKERLMRVTQETASRPSLDSEVMIQQMCAQDGNNFLKNDIIKRAEMLDPVQTLKAIHGVRPYLLTGDQVAVSPTSAQVAYSHRPTLAHAAPS